MRRKTLFVFALLVLVAATTLVAATAEPLATQFSVPWWTVDGGGGTSQGGVYILSGSVGQPDAGQSGGGVYELSGGFWNVTQRHYWVSLPLLRK